MRRIRFSVAGLMAVILLLAVGMAALRDPTELWASAIFTAAVTLFAASIMGAMTCRGVARFSWTGMAVFGWVYVICSFGSLMVNSVGMPPLLPSSLLDQLQEHIISDGKSPYIGDIDWKNHVNSSVQWHRNASTTTAWPATGRRRVNLTAYQQTGHSLGAMLFGILGAFVGRFFGGRRGRSTNDG
jgi:hypothetical protein